MELKSYAEEILATALENGGDMAEIFLEERHTTQARCEDSKLERVTSGTDRGAGLRVLLGDQTAYAYTNDVSRDGLLALARRVSEGINYPKGKTQFDFRVETHSEKVKTPPEEVPIERKTELIRAAEAAARQVDARIVQVPVYYGDSLQKVSVVNSMGRYVQDERRQIFFMVMCIAAANGDVQTGMEPVGGAVGFELFDEHDPEELARQAAHRAIVMLEADKAPAGVMPVVIGSEAGGTMIHEAVGHGLEADLVQKGLSKFGGRMGEKIAAEGVTVIDDGTLTGKRGSARIDDEGNPCRRNVLIENGVLRGFMHNHLTSNRDGVTPTGNGRRESFREKPIPRMTNTFVDRGTVEPSEVLAATDRGLYVARMGGGQVNTVNGDFLFEVSEGYLIEGGKKARPVRGASLVGNGPEVLLNIDMVGLDMGFGIGTCGKEGQGVPVSDAQPTLRIRQLTVGGTQVA